MTLAGAPEQAMDGVLLQFPNLDPTTRWWLIIAISLTVFYLIMRPRRRKSKDAQPARPGSLASQRNVERDMNNLLVELSEMARQITAQLDTRTAKLELLMKEADQKLAELRGAVKSTASSPSPVTATMRMEIPLPDVDAKYEEIYSLSDQGHTAHDIAHQLDRPHGEIELILALRPKSLVH